MTLLSNRAQTLESNLSKAVPVSYPAVGEQWVPRDATIRANAMTCDVEDYFQVSAFEHLVSKESWAERECRIPQNVDRALGLYADAGVQGTFFILGWVAEHLPEVVRRIAAEGHEIASHGMMHTRVWDQSPEQFREDITRTKRCLEEISGQEVLGFRAASWSLDRRTPWAHEVMAAAGYRYSSSIYPIAHDHYGMPDAPTRPFYERSSGILEIPATTSRLAGRNLPAAGGGYFRLLPLVVSRWLLKRFHDTTGLPAMFYFHPWELDPEQPRIPGASFRARFRHYLNLERFEKRFRVLLASMRWDRMDRIYLGPR